jgi:hypothetical protein
VIEDLLSDVVGARSLPLWGCSPDSHEIDQKNDELREPVQEDFLSETHIRPDREVERDNNQRANNIDKERL